ncbi:hypothetical protein QE357_001558 [Siphonobacter sp. BAB-5404]|nr:hypothetical protein [Siphonobacter sp. SORGH_AS_0500]
MNFNYGCSLKLPYNHPIKRNSDIYTLKYTSFHDIPLYSSYHKALTIEYLPY